MIDWAKRQLTRSWHGLQAVFGLRSADDQKSAFETMWMVVWIALTLTVGVAVPPPFDYLLFLTALVGFIGFLRLTFPGFNRVWNRIVDFVLFWR